MPERETINRGGVRFGLARCCAGAILIALTSVRASACDPELLSQVPQSAEAVIVVDRAGELVRSASGARLAAVLEDTGAIEPIRPAWDTLAAQLELDRTKAFDALLGRRVVIAFRGVLVPGAPLEWAMVSDVDRETERRLRARLEVGARRLVRGHQVLAIEGGAYELATHPQPEGRVTLVLGPADATGLFDGVLEVLNGDAEPISRGAPARDMARLGKSQALLVSRLEPGSWEQYVLAGARVTERGLAGSVLLRDPASAGQLGRIEPSPDAPFRALREGALVAVLEAAIPGDDDPTPGFLRVWGLLGDPGAVQGLTGLLGRRQAMVVRKSDAPPGVSLTLAFELGDVEQAASACDSFMVRQVGALRSIFEGQAGEAPSFDGMFPAAVRSVSIRRPAETPAGLLPSSLDVGWAYRQGLAPDQDPAQAGAGGDAAHTPASWWIAGAMPGSAEASSGSIGDLLRAAGDDLVTQNIQGAESRCWYSVGVVRPQDLERALAPGVPDLAGWRSAASRVARAEWRLYVTPDGAIAGEAELDWASDP